MKRILTIIIAMAVAGVAAGAQGVVERCERRTMRNQGHEREYYVYRPESIKPGAPLVIALHGYGGSALKGKPGLMDAADRYGFEVCYPQGISDGKKPCWNVGYPFQKDMKSNDIRFLKALKQRLIKEDGLNARNVFLTGMSNGGEMCYLMAQKSPRTFKAIASIAGLTLEDMSREYRRPVPFMEVHGTQDHTSEWTGDPENAGGWGAYLAVPVSVSYIVAADRCVSETKTELPLVRNKVILHEFKGGLPAWKGGPDCEVWLYEVIGGGHSWAESDMATFDEIWRFFSMYLEKSE